MKSRVLVCGGRDYEDRDKVNATLDYCCQFFEPDFVLIHGSARGADRLAHVWAFFKGCAVIEMKANWDFYGKTAGHIRNEWMLKFAMPDLVIAFPGGPGTRDMIRQAMAAGVDVYAV